MAITAVRARRYLLTAVDGKPLPELDEGASSAMADSISNSDGSEMLSEDDAVVPTPAADAAGPSGRRPMDPRLAPAVALRAASVELSASSDDSNPRDAKHRTAKMAVERLASPIRDDAVCSPDRGNSIGAGGSNKGVTSNRGIKRGRLANAVAATNEPSTPESGDQQTALQTPQKKPRSRANAAGPSQNQWQGSAGWLADPRQAQAGPTDEDSSFADDPGSAAHADGPPPRANTVRLRLKSKGNGGNASPADASREPHGGSGRSRHATTAHTSAVPGSQNVDAQSNLGSRQRRVQEAPPEPPPKRTRRAPARLSPDAYADYEDYESEPSASESTDGKSRSRRKGRQVSLPTTRTSTRQGRGRAWD